MEIRRRILGWKRESLQRKWQQMVLREEVLSWKEVTTVVLQKSALGLVWFNILPNVLVTKSGAALLKFAANRNSEGTAVIHKTMKLSYKMNCTSLRTGGSVLKGSCISPNFSYVEHVVQGNWLNSCYTQLKTEVDKSASEGVFFRHL